MRDINSLFRDYCGVSCHTLVLFVHVFLILYLLYIKKTQNKLLLQCGKILFQLLFSIYNLIYYEQYIIFICWFENWYYTESNFRATCYDLSLDITKYRTMNLKVNIEKWEVYKYRRKQHGTNIHKFNIENTLPKKLSDELKTLC